MEDKKHEKEEGCCSTEGSGCCSGSGCNCLKGLIILILFLLGGVIGYLVGSHCNKPCKSMMMGDKPCPMAPAGMPAQK